MCYEYVDCLCCIDMYVGQCQYDCNFVHRCKSVCFSAKVNGEDLHAAISPHTEHARTVSPRDWLP